MCTRALVPSFRRAVTGLPGSISRVAHGTLSAHVPSSRRANTAASSSALGSRPSRRRRLHPFVGGQFTPISASASRVQPPASERNASISASVHFLKFTRKWYTVSDSRQSRGAQSPTLAECKPAMNVLASMRLLNVVDDAAAACAPCSCRSCLSLDPAFEAACGRALLAVKLESFLIVNHAAMSGERGAFEWLREHSD